MFSKSVNHFFITEKLIVHLSLERKKLNHLASILFHFFKHWGQFFKVDLRFKDIMAQLWKCLIERHESWIAKGWMIIGQEANTCSLFLGDCLLSNLIEGYLQFMLGNSGWFLPSLIYKVLHTQMYSTHSHDYNIFHSFIDLSIKVIILQICPTM